MLTSQIVESGNWEYWPERNMMKQLMTEKLGRQSWVEIICCMINVLHSVHN